MSDPAKKVVLPPAAIDKQLQVLTQVAREYLEQGRELCIMTKEDFDKKDAEIATLEADSEKAEDIEMTYQKETNTLYKQWAGLTNVEPYPAWLGKEIERLVKERPVARVECDDCPCRGCNNDCDECDIADNPGEPDYDGKDDPDIDDDDDLGEPDGPDAIDKIQKPSTWPGPAPNLNDLFSFRTATRPREKSVPLPDDLAALKREKNSLVGKPKIEVAVQFALLDLQIAQGEINRGECAKSLMNIESARNAINLVLKKRNEPPAPCPICKNPETYSHFHEEKPAPRLIKQIDLGNGEIKIILEKPSPNAFPASHTLASTSSSPAAMPRKGQVDKKDGKAGHVVQGDFKLGDTRCVCHGTGFINTPSGKRPCPICNRDGGE